MEKSSSKPAKYLLFAAACLLALYILYLTLNVFIILAVSILISLVFNPVAKMLEKNGLNRRTASLAIFGASAILIYVVIAYLIPQFFLQLNQLILALHVSSLHEHIFSVEKEIYKFVPFFTLGELTKRTEHFISSGIVNSIDQISTLFTSIVSIITIVIIVPFITFFLLKDNKKIMQGILQMVPNKYFEMTYWILKKVSIQLGRFVRGWIFDATFVGLTSGLGYYLIGVNNSLPLGLISGLGHLVPYFGPVIGGIPAIVISIIQYGNFSHVPYIIILISLVYVIDNGIVQPFVFSKSVDMHPIIIILLILIGSELLGVPGMLLAIPFATAVRTAIKEIYFAYKNYKIARL